jgi:diguanylate cyclase (GGDEF)-like protein
MPIDSPLDLDVPPPRESAAAETSAPLRYQLFRVLLVAVLAPALILAALQTAFEYRQVERDQRDRLRLSVRLTATSIDQFVQSHLAAVALTAAGASRTGEPPDLAGMRALFPSFVTALATDAEGRIVQVEPASRAAGAPLRSVADREYFSVPARDGQPYVSNAFVGRGLGSDALVAVSAPMRVDGAFAGVVEGSIKVDTFTALRSSALRSRGQEMLLVDRAGRVIHASAGLGYRFAQPLGRARMLRGREAADGVSAVTVVEGVMPGTTWVAWAQLRSGWRVAVIQPRRAALAGVWRGAVESAAVLALVTLLVLLVANAQVKRVSRALGATLEHLRAIAAGEQAPQLQAEAVPSELGPMARQVVQLATELQQANVEVREALAGQQALARHLREANERLEETVRARTAELQVANRDLARLAHTDALTGAINLRGLQAEYARLSDADGRLARAVAVILFDADFFKAFNDRYGHPAGDQALRRVVAAAQAAMRGQGERVARVGGEEFIALLPDADASMAARVAERIRADVEALGIPNAGGNLGPLTVSLGVAAGAPGERIDAVVRRADEALYRAKADGRNRVAT